MITIGSGYRAYPKSTNIQDCFYVLNDENVLGITTNVPAPLTEGELATPAALASDYFLPDDKGWFKYLVNSAGEKVLSTPLIFMGKVMFTTFGITTSNAQQIDPCSQAGNNESRAYVMDLMSGSTTIGLDGDVVISQKDESIIIGMREMLLATI